MFVATKFCTPQGHLPRGTPVNDYMRSVEESLRRLRADHVDLVHIHACDDLLRLLDPGAHEAFFASRSRARRASSVCRPTRLGSSRWRARPSRADGST
jgi:aryl-alcohol dehydrogenase-like predicted oxidoreductase